MTKIKNQSIDSQHIEYIDFKDKKGNEFRGIIGVNPSETFECLGYALSKQGNVIVSDSLHHSIHLLDSDLKFIKCLYDASDDIDAPSAIALKDGRLWVVDVDKIKIFEFKEEQTNN